MSFKKKPSLFLIWLVNRAASLLSTFDIDAKYLCVAEVWP